MSEASALTEPKEIRLSLADHFAVVIRSPRIIVIHWLIALALASLFWVFDLTAIGCFCFNDVPFPWMTAVIIGLLLSASFLIVTPLLSHNRIQKLMKGAPIVIQLLESGVYSKVPTAEGVAYWPSLKRVERSNDRLFLFINRCSAYVIARREFATTTEWELWAKIAEERFSNAKG